jgi:O-antigen/teichoic acid export membrane protein
MAVLSLVSFLLYAAYCLKKYNECSIKKYQIDKPLIRELGGFAGWNLFGAACGVGQTQGLAIILNIFFGTIVNAAYGIAIQVSGQLQFFSQTMLRALNPQIMKSEGMNDRQRMLRLSMMASKFGFFLLAFIAIPVIFEMPAILKIWLKEVPEHAVTFCSLILIGALANQLTVGLQSAIQSTGKIKMYQSIVGSILLFNLPISYLLLKLNSPAYSVMISFIITEMIACGFRLFLLKKIADLSIGEYFNRVFLKEIIPVIMSIVACYLLVSHLQFSFRFSLTFIISIATFGVGIYIFGLHRDEKNTVNILINKILKINK